MPGSQVTEDEALRIVRERFRYPDYCIVRDWIWIDLDVSAEQLEALRKTRRQPVIVYANTVIYDSNERALNRPGFLRHFPGSVNVASQTLPVTAGC